MGRLTGHDRNNDYAKDILATHVGGFLDPFAGHDPQFEKSCPKRHLCVILYAVLAPFFSTSKHQQQWSIQFIYTLKLFTTND